jgi:hypothetical protein
MRKVVLLGTNHRYQMFGELSPVTPTQFEEFIAMVRDVIARNGIRSIGEEMNKESLKKHFCRGESFTYQVAQELGIEHRYCDPDSATRKSLSIPEGEEGWPKREQYWLERLQTFNEFPAMFIMGARHFKSFRNLLRQSGFEAIEVERDWVPSDFVTDEEVERRFFEG